MDVFLNFILLHERDTYPDWCFDGPLTVKTYNNYSYTHFPEIKEGYLNYILIEPREALKSFIRQVEKFSNHADYLKKNNIKVILASLADPPNQPIYNELVLELKKYNLFDYFIIVSSNMNLRGESNLYCFNYFIEDSLLYKNSFFTKNDLGYLSEEIDVNELDVFRNKKFLSFNKTIDKQHRYSLFHDYLTNDFSDSYFSFLQLEGLHCTPYQKNLLDLNEYQKNIPVEIDTNGNFDFSTHNTFKKDLFLDSCIHLVTETSFHDNELFISEKVFKPIVNYQPFIVLGPAYYLKELKKFGFKTFSDLWDESYDEIQNPSDRYFKISDLILDLNKKSIQELNEIYKKTKDIVIYNRNLFYTLELNDLKNFLNLLGDKKRWETKKIY
jgi:hypothetical protein